MSEADKRIRIDPTKEQRDLAAALAELDGCKEVDIYNRAVKAGLVILEKHVRAMWGEVEGKRKSSGCVGSGHCDDAFAAERPAVYTTRRGAKSA